MNANTQDALNRLNKHDFYWMMEDYGYIQNKRDAEADMRRFVAVVNTIEDATVREALRELWTLNYKNAQNRMNGKQTEGYEERKAELMNVIAA